MSANLTLAIAGLPLGIACAPDEFAAQIASRYRGYLTLQTAEWQLVLDLAGTGQLPARSDPQVTFASGGASVAGAGWHGSIDDAARTAWLRASPANGGAALEYFLRVLFAGLAFEAGGLLIHAAGLVRDRRAYLFCGPSGSGKTTVARLSQGAAVLNDDLIVLRPAAAGWEAHSTPFTGPDQVPPIAQPTAAPLAALLRLVQAPAVALDALSPSLALAEVLASLPVLPADPVRLPALMGRAQALVSAVHVYQLRFRQDDSFWAALASLDDPDGHERAQEPSAASGVLRLDEP